MSDELRPGYVIEGRYELLAFIGEGGFARVWRARDRQLGREVAVKLLNLGAMALGNASSVNTVLQRFEREARLAASIHHPNVVQIHDIGHLKGIKERPFIVMELLTGDDLKARIDQQGPCDPTTFIPQFINCLDGLARAHEVGIVHKDLKPSNLFLSDPGRRTETLKLVDFGIAHISQPSPEDAAARLTSTGQLLGTPQYLPPEYIHSQQVSPAMDVYQMSLVLVEALTAEYVLGHESSLQCLIIHGDGRLEIPRYLLESPLAPVLKKGLSRDPALRYPDAEALADALGALACEHIPARPHTNGQPLERIRLDGSKLTAQNPHVALAPALFTEVGVDAGVVPGQVPGQHSGARHHTPDAFMHTLDSVPSIARPEAQAVAAPPAQAPPVQAPLAHTVPAQAPTPMVSQQAPTFTPSAMHHQPAGVGRGAQRKSSNGFNMLLFVCLGMGVLGGSCVCCMALETDSDEQEHVDFNPNQTEVSAPVPSEQPPEVMVEEFDMMGDLGGAHDIPTLGGKNTAVRDAAIALQVDRATQMLERGKVEGALKLCDDLIREVAGTSIKVEGCYNVVSRASSTPAGPFGESDRRGCTRLKEYLDAYPEHQAIIGTQRSIMKCVEHDL